MWIKVSKVQNTTLTNCPINLMDESYKKSPQLPSILLTNYSLVIQLN